MQPNPALNLAPVGRWTLRDKATQCRLAPRSASFCFIHHLCEKTQ